MTATVAPGHWLAEDAAASYLRMLRDGCPAGITSAGRTYAEQAELRRKYLRGGNFALPPGTSEHEKGLALDLPEPARAWVREHGHAYGWVKDVNPAEPWHQEYRADLDTKEKEDDVSKEDVIVGVHELLKQAAERSTPTGRQAGDYLVKILDPLVTARVAEVGDVDLDELADRIAAELPATSLTKADVRSAAKSALREVLTKGVE